MEKFFNKKTVTGSFIILLLVISITCSNSSKTFETAGNILSNKLIGWGIKREENHNQPDVGNKNKEILEKNNGICLGNKEKAYIYLTFDEGYEAGYTAQILDILKKNNVTATFFITSHYLNTEPELVKRMLDEGHIVGNHTVNHKSLPTLSDEKVKSEIMNLHKEIYEKFDYEMKYIRPPKGEFSERTLYISNSLGYKTVMWSFAYCDWDENNQLNEEKAKEMIINNLHNGEIILLHGNSKTNTNILDSTIKYIKNQNYEFKSLEQFEK
ncbi:MAG: polysaccharide deacetylase family protein [Clostridia bacterium]|nr:polysaccharide deacetylase family protein [Clostridia bacterium]